MGDKNRLPDNVRPLNYDLHFEPSFEDFTFSGREIIDIQVTRPTQEIILNSKDIEIQEATISYGDKNLEATVEMDKDNERVIFRFDEHIASTNAKLSLKFKGVLNDELSGFYRSKYKTRDGQEKYMATTQFEAPYARKAFPCFDEPSYKATFDVSMTIDKDYQAIANTPIINENVEDGKKTVKFGKSPLMSTYLLYMGVGDFEFLEDQMKREDGSTVDIRIVTVPGKSEQGKFAMDLTKRFLTYFEDYFDIDYPLPKLDMLAIPDFSAGAMENWGAITFREVLLLHEEGKTSEAVKERIAEVVSHELVHQWFGNLVTMKWWNDLWLNESFATYMAFKAVDHEFPEWDMWESFIKMETDGAFYEDSLKSTHPIEVEVKSPNQIEEIFDAISYGKGGSVLRMIDNYLGEENFRDGVRKYLSDFKYKNAAASDLWSSLAQASGDPKITGVMENWIKRPGYPIVEAVKDGSSISLSQKKFVRGLDSGEWKIPLVLRYNGNEKRQLLESHTGTIDADGTDWFKLNSGQKGFYRVRYSDDNLAKLKALVENKELDEFDRWGLQNDLYNLTKVGEVTLDKYLDFIQAYRNEDNHFVLENISDHLKTINRVFSQDKDWESIESKFKNLVKEPFKKNFDALGWDAKKGETKHDALLRAVSIGYLAFADDEEILNEGKSRFEKRLNGESLNPDLSGIVYSVAAKTGDRETFDKMKKVFEDTEDGEDKLKLLQSLGKFYDTGILRDYLDYAVNPENVRIQNIRRVFPSVAANPVGRDVLFPWVKDNWEKLEDYKKTHFIFMGLLESLITPYTGEDKKHEIKEFLDLKNTGYEKTKRNSFEIMDINTDWMKKNRKVLKDYFSS